jgi:hypothetical protein
MVVGDMSLTSACCIVAHNDYKVEKFAFDKNNEFWCIYSRGNHRRPTH